MAISKNTKQQREAWLVQAAKRITRKWAKLGVTVPADVQFFCDFPGGGSPHRLFGECLPRERSEKKFNQIFMNPVMGSGVKVIDVLGHELLHAADDCASGHGRVFSRNSRLVGYSGGKHSKAETCEAVEFIGRLVKSLGEYPNGATALNPQKPKRSAGLHKYACVYEGGDVLYTTEKNVVLHGVPSCRCCGEPMESRPRTKRGMAGAAREPWLNFYDVNDRERGFQTVWCWHNDITLESSQEFFSKEEAVEAWGNEELTWSRADE